MQEAYVFTASRSQGAARLEPSMVARAFRVPSSLIAYVQCIQRMFRRVPGTFSGRGIGNKNAPAV